MEALAPLGPVYQAGTLSGNPLAMAAGIATIEVLRDGNHYEMLDRFTSNLCEEMGKIFEKKGLPTHLNREGSMFTFFFTDGEVHDFASALKSDTRLYAAYFREMLRRGVSLAPSQFEASFVSIAHTDHDLERTVEACGKAVENILASPHSRR